MQWRRGMPPLCYSRGPRSSASDSEWLELTQAYAIRSPPCALCQCDAPHSNKIEQNTWKYQIESDVSLNWTTFTTFRSCLLELGAGSIIRLVFVRNWFYFLVRNRFAFEYWLRWSVRRPTKIARRFLREQIFWIILKTKNWANVQRIERVWVNCIHFNIFIDDPIKRRVWIH